MVFAFEPLGEELYQFFSIFLPQSIRTLWILFHSGESIPAQCYINCSVGTAFH